MKDPEDSLDPDDDAAWEADASPFLGEDAEYLQPDDEEEGIRSERQFHEELESAEYADEDEAGVNDEIEPDEAFADWSDLPPVEEPMASPLAGRSSSAFSLQSSASPSPVGDLPVPGLDQLRTMLAGKRVALVHDWLNGMRGGEKVFEQFCALFPGADVYTLFYEPDKVSERIRSMRVQEHEWPRRMPALHECYRMLLPLMPRMIASFPTQKYDLVISTSHCVAKGARPPARGLHLSYIFSPMRYVWDHFKDYLGDNWAKNEALRWVRPRLREWDRRTAREIDSLAADSRHIARKVAKFWSRKARVIYPPVDLEFFTPGIESGEWGVGSGEWGGKAEGGRLKAEEPHGDDDDPTNAAVVESLGSPELFQPSPPDSSPLTPLPYFLCVGALVPYKKFDRAIEAVRLAGERLVIVGDGPEKQRLMAMGGKRVEFRGWVPDGELRDAYRSCKALIYPGVEDFGITALEAQACGRPVLALRLGGARETVVEGRTGRFFDVPDAENLARLLTEFRSEDYNSSDVRAHAERFSAERFQSEVVCWITREAKRLGWGREHAAPFSSSSNS